MLECGVHLRMLSHTQEWNELHVSMKERLHALWGSMKERLHALWGTVMMGWLLGSIVN